MFGAISTCDIPVTACLVPRLSILMVLERPDVFVSFLPTINDSSERNFIFAYPIQAAMNFII